MYHAFSRVQSGRGAAYPCAVAGRIACKDASLCEAFSCPWTLPAPFDPQREIARIKVTRPPFLHANASSNALASCRSGVSKPSVNQP
jgi:hypothetical protein